MKYEFGWKILIELTALKQKRNRYLTDGTIIIKNQQVLKSASLNEKLILKIIKQCLEATQLEKQLHRKK